MSRKKYFDNYDYEEAYNEQLEKLSEYETERLFREDKKKAGYRTTTTKAGDSLEVDIYPSFKNAGDCPRTKRKRESRKAQKNLNDKRARRYLNTLVSCNFGKGDLWGTFTYDEGHKPESIDEAQKRFSNFVRRVNRRRKKAGKENLKYICVTEYSDDPEKGIRAHHHVIFSGDVDRDEIEGLWTDGSRTETKRLAPDPKTHVAGLVNYITKDPKGRKRWNASRGLKKPIVTRSYCKFGKRSAERMATDHEYLEQQLLKKYPGYSFVDAKVFINDINGGFYIYGRMVRD